MTEGIKHGTYSSYTNHGCRCRPCTEANSAYHYAYMHADPERLRRHAERTRESRARQKGGRDE